MADQDTANVLVFFVNGSKIRDPIIDGNVTLIDYLRSRLALPGTKTACGVGGCGACTVMVSRYNAVTEQVDHCAVNACITPVCLLYGSAITTVEGVGSLVTGIHPIQEAIALNHGTQCGYCSPGMVMSLYTLYRRKTVITQEDILRSLGGNLCRCTGYRPIVEGVMMVPCKDGCSLGKCCKLSSECAASDGRCCNDGKLQTLRKNSVIYGSGDVKRLSSTQEPVFPAELKLLEQEKNVIRLCSKRVTWYLPATLEQLLDLKNEHPEAYIAGGMIALGHKLREDYTCHYVVISGIRVSQLRGTRTTEHGLSVGSWVSLSELYDALTTTSAAQPEWRVAHFTVIQKALAHLGSVQIRNAATLGGHIMATSPTSDLNPILLVINASLTVASKNGRRTVPLDETFFTTEAGTRLKSSEVVLSVFLPFNTSQHEHMDWYKVSQRRNFAECIVNCAMRIQFVPQTSEVNLMNICYGGIASKLKIPHKTEKLFHEQTLNSNLLKKAYQSLLEEVEISPDAAGGLYEYKTSIVRSFLYKFSLSSLQYLRAKVDVLLKFLYVILFSKRHLLYSSVGNNAIIFEFRIAYNKHKSEHATKLSAIIMRA